MRVRAWRLRKFSFGQLFLFVLLLLLVLVRPHPALAQGVATGGTAVPARPLPAGMKAPAVEYRDIANQAGIVGVNVSGSETSKQYIVETTGNGVAIFDFDSDDLPHTPHPGQTSQCQWKGKPVMCGPRGLPPETLSFYQNDGQGNFTDVSDQVHVSGPKNYYGFAALTGDFDNDGWPDIFVACDSTASLYYHNIGGKRFEEIGVRAGLAYNEDGREQAGMGAAAADFDGDSLLDIFKTNFADDTHTMYKNQGGNNFADDTIGSGLAVNTKYLGWGTAFLDFDNDGWKDLVVANGHVYPEVDTGRTDRKSTRLN